MLVLLVFLLLAVAAGWLAGSAAARATLRGEIERFRAELVPHEALTPIFQPVGIPEPSAPEPPAPGDGITPEILAILTATVAAFLGKKAHVRGARLLRPTGSDSAWAQQGRVFVQASHNLQRSSRY